MRRNRRRSHLKRGRRAQGTILAICLGLFLLLGACGWFYIDGQVYRTVRVEAGVAVAASDFLRKAGAEAVFAQSSQPFDTAEPGDYQVRVKSGLFTYRCRLIIEDTIPPEAEARPVQRKVGEVCGAEEFLSDIRDATQVAVSYRAEPDFRQAGPQAVEILLTDRGGNQTALESELYLVQIADSVEVEIGGEAPGLDSFAIVARDASLLTKVDEIDYGKAGEYEILLDVSGISYSSMLRVVDSVPPQLEVRDVEGYLLVPRKADEFVVRAEDATQVTFSFRKEPDLSLSGSQEVEIVATDEGGNETSKRAVLTLQEDKEAPVIRGAKNLTYLIGGSISYRKRVAVTDNSGEEVSLEVDTSGVNLTKEGVYPVVYSATDAAGNVASVTVNLTVKASMYTEEDVYALADAVLADIIKPEMSLRDQVWAIYSYVMGHVGYISHAEKGDWIKAVYEGLTQGKGDCYVYACVTKVLLVRAGITNLDIEKIPAKTEHYWNLVDIGEGWRHLDTTPRKDHPTIFLWTDEEMMDYSVRHNNSHNYDRSLYPEMN